MTDGGIILPNSISFFDTTATSIFAKLCDNLNILDIKLRVFVFSVSQYSDNSSVVPALVAGSSSSSRLSSLRYLCRRSIIDMFRTFVGKLYWMHIINMGKAFSARLLIIRKSSSND